MATAFSCRKLEAYFMLYHELRCAKLATATEILRYLTPQHTFQIGKSYYYKSYL
ncbi:hypothetical protein [Mucilaginibacter terrigena]|uniref:hypothetical protein n=1 Tax=Mucilaginibacter terrigena TaxID=2492395 RepID=UPI00139678C2|nr:hypothetical protein [Mucilaginibacter terrigena]